MKTTPLNIPILLAALATMTLFPPVARADTVRLRGEATATGSVVRLGDVAELNGAEIELHAMLPVLTWSEGQERAAIALDTVRSALAAANVNLAKVTFSGRLACDVGRQVVEDKPTADTPAAGTPDAPITAGPVARDLLVDLLVGMAGVTDPDDLRFSFTDPSAMLDRAAAEGRYEFEPLATVIPGRVPVVVRRYADDTLVEQARVNVDVERRYQAVVTERRIPRGQVLHSDDVAVQPVFVRGGAEPIERIESVLGQAATGTLQAGDMLAAGDVQAPRLVRRGDDMTVRCIVGNLVIRLTGTAMEDGGRDQMIRVRNTSSRETFLARVTGAHEAELVRPADDAAEKDPDGVRSNEETAP